MSQEFTQLPDIPQIHAKLKAKFRSGKTQSVEYRLHQLKALYDCLEREQTALLDATALDGKCRQEAHLVDILLVKKELALFSKDLHSWLQPERKSLDLVNSLSLDAGSVRLDPLGVVLIIGTWNYPINTSLIPLIGALAAGNCVVLKLSEVSHNLSSKLAQTLRQYLDPDCFRVVLGAVEQSTALLKLKWDHIFYTGNGTVGRIIARAAAEHLTPCTLELGGKSPVYIDADSPIDLAACVRRIAFGKFVNSGQSCIAPDYVLLPSRLQEAFIAEMRTAIRGFYGSDSQTAFEWKDYSKIASDRHFQRLDTLLKHSKGKVVIQGPPDAKNRLFPPHIVVNVMRDDALMKDEIFGPLLPIVTCDSLDDAIEFINDGDKPLAAYIFSNDHSNVQKFQERVPAGGIVVNDVVMHYSVNALPFGGVGESGVGRYHGIFSLKCFSHEKPVLWRSLRTEPVSQYLIYPPYTERKSDIVGKVLVGKPSF